MFILFCSQCALKDKAIKDQHKCAAHIQSLKLYFYRTFDADWCCSRKTGKLIIRQTDFNKIKQTNKDTLLLRNYLYLELNAHMPVLALVQNVLLFTMCDTGQKAFFFYYFVLDYRPKPSATIVRWAVISYKTAFTCFFSQGQKQKKEKKKQSASTQKTKYRPKKDIFLQGLIECSCLVPHSHPYMNKQQPFSVDKHRHTQRHADVLCSRKTASGNLS